MRLIEDKIEGLRYFEDTIVEVIQGVINENYDVITYLNSEDQLNKRGVDRNGVSIAAYEPYRPLTLKIKRAKRQPIDRVTLRDTGAFHRSFKLNIGPTAFEITPTDLKTEMLIEKYGEEILGLTDENAQYFIDNYIKPALFEHLKAWL